MTHSVRAAADELRERSVIGLQSKGQGQLLFAVDRLEDGKMQMRSAGESGLAGIADRLAHCHLIAHLHQRSSGFQMHIIGERSIRVLDDDTIRQRS